ncbi:MAG: hypothetical protein HY321_17025 [Armatimonadetes bacterium]|nr:hypothetical protein [Armatimonadota bacterium]
MNSRERVQAVLRHRVPDSVPHGLYDVTIENYNDTTLEFFQKMTGKHPRDCFRHDIRNVNMKAIPRAPDPGPRDRAPDGRSWRAVMSEVESVDDLRRTGFYEAWVPTPWRVEDVKPQIDALHADGYACFGGIQGTIGMTVWRLRGQSQFLMDLADRPAWLEVLLDWVTEATIADMCVSARAHPDIHCLWDDFGTQRGLLFSPQTFQELFVPRYKRVVDAIKRVDPEGAVFYHCCGDATPIIPALIEAGIDILNPLQPEAMDPVAVKREFGKDLVLWGGLGVQSTLSRGTPQDVDDAVGRLMETVGKDGGYILTPAHMINPDIPWENIVAFFEAAERYGNYG